MAGRCWLTAKRRRRAVIALWVVALAVGLMAASAAQASTVTGFSATANTYSAGATAVE